MLLNNFKYRGVKVAVKKNIKVLLVEQDLDNALSLEFIKEDWEIVRYSHPTEVNT